MTTTSLPGGSASPAGPPGSYRIIDVDPLFDEGPGAMIELCERFGRYRTYAEHEKIPSDVGSGLSQRHDSILNIIRTGGLRRAHEPADVLIARTSYFREEYAYGDAEFAPGIGAFLHHPRFLGAASAVHGRPVIEPAIAYANLMVPGQELAVHTDVPEFRGVNRKVVPQWLLVVMHHSGLFEPWRLHIATGVAWFHDSDLGALAFWPGGASGPEVLHRIRSNTAVVLDTDTVFHGVVRVSDDRAVVVPPVGPGSVLEFAGGGLWLLRSPDDAVVGTYEWNQLRFSVSWKAYCFADEAERRSWREHTDDLSHGAVVDRLVDDLADRGIVQRGVTRDQDLGLTLINTYIRFPDAADQG